MDRFEIIGVVLVIIAAVPVAVFLFYVISATLLAARYSLWPPKPRPDAETPFGPFVWDGDSWNGVVSLASRTIAISLRDFDQKPNSSFLDKLPGIAENLTALEQVARSRVDSISATHALDQIVDDAEVDFVLGFSWDNEAWGESVYVSFRDNEVVSWQTVD